VPAFRGPASVRRNTELGLLLMVALITVAMYSLMTLARYSEVPPYIWTFLIVVLGVLLVAHLVTRQVAPRANPTLLPLAGLLNGIGFVFIARVREDLAWQQATWTAIGIGVYCLTLVVIRRARDLDKYRWTFALIGMLLLALPAIPGLGTDLDSGSKIWVKVPGLGFTFQPGEPAKVVLAIFFASYLVEKRELLAFGRRVGPITLPELRHLGPVLVAWGASLLVLLYQNDLGSSLLFFMLFLVMLWVATQRTSYMVVGMSMFVAGAVAVWSQVPRVQDRVQGWIDPFAKPRDDCCYQISQYQFLMADGGVAGTGMSMSGSLAALPQRESDFIFAVIAAELGLPGALAVITCFILFVGAGLHIAQEAEAGFDKLLATGLTAMLGIQAFIIMAGVTRVLPLTGVTLPFVSYGGTSLLFNYVLIALLTRISDETAHAPVSNVEMVPV
jgi:cell division protein FtsW (lipid II flippase)